MTKFTMPRLAKTGVLSTQVVNNNSEIPTKYVPCYNFSIILFRLVNMDAKSTSHPEDSKLSMQER
jgi:hypothetical protein